MVVFGHEEPEEVDRKENIEQLPVGETNRKKLVNICKTRRVARVEAFEVFHQVLPAVSQTFENISSNSSWNAESRQKNIFFTALSYSIPVLIGYDCSFCSNSLCLR